MNLVKTILTYLGDTCKFIFRLIASMIISCTMRATCYKCLIGMPVIGGV